LSWQPLALVGAAVLVAGAFSNVSNAPARPSSAPGVTAKTISLGLFTSFTGPVAAGFSTVPDGFNARIALQNAEGGVDGRQLKVVNGDDQGSPTGAQAAAQTLVEQDHVFAVGAVGIFTFAAEPFFLKADEPVAGGAFDGTEWAPPDNNMFPNSGSPDPHYPAPVVWGRFFKQQGVTRLAIVGGPIPSALLQAKDIEASAKAAGIKVVYVDQSIPTAQNGNFENLVQQMKSDKVNGIWFNTEVQASFSILETAAQDGLIFKANAASAEAPSAVFQNPEAQKDGQNSWASTPYVPPTINNPGVKELIGALAKYEHQKALPDRNEYEGWIAADILITGLKLAGPNPTQASFLSKLRADNDYTADGLEVSPVSFNKSFGTGALDVGPAPQDCSYFVQYKGKQYVSPPKPICGGLVPNSNAK